MARSTADIRPIDPDFATAADVALLRPPSALWGYNMQATDEALNLVARTVTERDVEIANLRREVAELKSAAENPQAAGQGQTGQPGPAVPGGRPPGVAGPVGLARVPASPPVAPAGPPAADQSTIVTGPPAGPPRSLTRPVRPVDPPANPADQPASVTGPPAIRIGRMPDWRGAGRQPARPADTADTPGGAPARQASTSATPAGPERAPSGSPASPAGPPDSFDRPPGFPARPPAGLADPPTIPGRPVSGPPRPAVTRAGLPASPARPPASPASPPANPPSPPASPDRPGDSPETWSAWERPGTAPPPEPGESEESE